MIPADPDAIVKDEGDFLVLVPLTRAARDWAARRFAITVVRQGQIALSPRRAEREAQAMRDAGLHVLLT